MQKNQYLVPEIRRVQIAPHHTLTTFFRSFEGTAIAGAAFEQLYIKPGSGQFQQTKVPTENGDLYEMELNYMVPGTNTPANRQRFRALQNQTFLVHFTDCDDKSFLLGNDVIGARCSYTYDLKRSGYSFTFTFTDTYPVL